MNGKSWGYGPGGRLIRDSLETQIINGVFYGGIIHNSNLRFFYIITFIFSFSFHFLSLHFVFRSAKAYSILPIQLSPALAGFFVLILKDPGIIRDISDHLPIIKFLKRLF